jgi:hypothetical protein
MGNDWYHQRRPVQRRLELPAGHGGLTAADIATNQFLDPSIQLR